MKNPKCILLILFAAWSFMPINGFAKTTTIAFLVYDKMNVLDYAGPREVLSQVGFGLEHDQSNDRVFTYTVGFPHASIKAIEGTTIVADYALGAEMPVPDIIVLPGARDEDVPLDPKILTWLKNHAAEKKQLMSVCTGAYFLAEAGLLNGRKATTHHLSFERFGALYPLIRLQKNVRYVDEGQILTTA
ncbi:MAG: hypothetical protein EOP11_20695, partial [Proteobacteria bacterium]